MHVLALVAEPEPFTAALVQALFILLVIRLLDVWEREPLWVLGVLALWGAVGATGIAAPLNGAFREALPTDVETLFGPAIVAPINEELAKGAALIVALLVSRWLARRYGVAEFNGPTDGMVYGAAIGLGFAFTENNVFFLNTAVEAGNIRAGLEVLNLREGFLNLGTLGHAVYTGAFGAGLGLATWSRGWGGRIGCSLLGLAAGMFMHALHNGLIPLLLVIRFGFDTTLAALKGEALPAELVARLNSAVESGLTLLDVFDYAFAALFVLGLVAWTIHQRRVLAFELGEEAAQGLITADENALLTRFGGRLRWYFVLLASGRVRELAQVRRHHMQLAELGFTKWRLRKTGADSAPLERLRAEVRAARAADTQIASKK